MIQQTDDTNSLSIARYILLFGAIVAFIAIVAWIIIAISRYGDTERNIDTKILNAIHECKQQVTDQITAVWTNEPTSIPQPYLDMATRYATQELSVPASGYCNNIAFSCLRGQIRRDCDPCAISEGMHRAMQQQISDVIQARCGQIHNKN